MPHSIKHINSIPEYHHSRELPPPRHPLISVVDYSKFKHANEDITYVQNFYSISVKRMPGIKIRYGQQAYDYDDGIMFFMAPKQPFRVEVRNTSEKGSGWILLIHPDFLWKTSLANTIKQYEFFNYQVNEALFLSEKEEAVIKGIVANIDNELNENIDKFSQDIIVSQIETLLNYSERFYQRQFVTRKISNHEVLSQLETILADHFENKESIAKGLPAVHDVSALLNMSPAYLSNLLKQLTGQTTQQLIHEKLIEKAKEKLSTTKLSVSEIAYALGFEHSQSFSKLFKAKTNQSPLQFRDSFN